MRSFFSVDEHVDFGVVNRLLHGHEEDVAVAGDTHESVVCAEMFDYTESSAVSEGVSAAAATIAAAKAASLLSDSIVFCTVLFFRVVFPMQN